MSRYYLERLKILENKFTKLRKVCKRKEKKNGIVLQREN